MLYVIPGRMLEDVDRDFGLPATFSLSFRWVAEVEEGKSTESGTSTISFHLFQLREFSDL